MKGYSDTFNNNASNISKSNSIMDMVDYNESGSSSVKKVDSVNITYDSHKLPDASQPNSVTKNYKNGSLQVERYYDNDGKPYLDIDYTDHGNAKTHPHVPHQHKITVNEKGKINREKETDICKEKD